MKNFIAVDIGNTSIRFAYFKDRRITKECRLETRGVSEKSLKTIKNKLPWCDASSVVVASVVPTASRVLKKLLPKIYGKPVYLIGSDIAVPIKNRYRNPKQVGIDRLMNALAAYSKYRRACVVLDFGTAITFDVISRNGEYLGGVISPGIEISLEALFDRTALLPKIRLAHPASVIGRDTVESIRSGCSFGIGGLCDRIVEMLEAKLGGRLKIIATGGYARFMSKYCRRIDAIQPNLVMQGIYLTYSFFLTKKAPSIE